MPPNRGQSSIARAHVMEGNQLLKVILWPPHTGCGTSIHTQTQTEIPTQKERENNVTKYLIQLGSGGTHQANLVYRMSSRQPEIHSNSLSKKY